MFQWFTGSQAPKETSDERQLANIQAELWELKSEHKRELEELKSEDKRKYNELRDASVAEMVFLTERAYQLVDTFVDARVAVIHKECYEKVAKSDRQAKRCREEATRCKEANVELFVYCRELQSEIRELKTHFKNSR